MADQREIAVTAAEVDAAVTRLAELEERARQVAASAYAAELSAGRGAGALVGVGSALCGFATELAEAIARTRAEVSAALATYEAADDDTAARIDGTREG